MSVSLPFVYPVKSGCPLRYHFIIFFGKNNNTAVRLSIGMTEFQFCQKIMKLVRMVKKTESELCHPMFSASVVCVMAYSSEQIKTGNPLMVCISYFLSIFILN